MPDVSVADFRAGLVIPGDPATEEQPGFAPDGALLTAQNVEFLGTGGVRGRRGRRRVLAPLAADPLGLFRHYPRENVKSYGPFKAGAVDETLSVPPGSFAWTIPAPTALQSVDDVFVQTVLAVDDVTNYLDISGFAATVPASANVVGIQVRVLRKAAPNARCFDALVQLLKAGVAVGDDRSNPTVNWGTMIGEASYGSAGDTWGEAWTPAEIATLGVRIQVKTDLATAPMIERVQLLVWTNEHVEPTLIGSTLDATASKLWIWDTITEAWIIPLGSDQPTKPGARPRFLTVPEQSSTYIFDGVNAPLQFTGSTFIKMEPTGELPIPLGPYAALWKNRLFVAQPSESDFSVYATAINDPTNFPSDLQLSMNDPLGGQIKGICALPDRLIVLKETSLFAFVGDIEFGGELFRYSGVGCVAPESVAVTPYGIIYVARGGVYLTDGSSGQPVELSAAIRPRFQHRTEAEIYSQAIGFYYPRLDQYWLMLDRYDDTIYVAQRVPGDAGMQFAWSTIPNDSNVEALWAAACPLQGAHDKGEWIVAGIDGVVREWDIGSDDEGQPIPVEIMTVRQEFDGESRLGRLVHLKPYFRAFGTMVLGLRYDGALEDDLTFAVGADGGPARFQEPRVTVVDQSVWGRWVQFRAASMEGPAFELHRINGDTMKRSVRRWP